MEHEHSKITNKNYQSNRINAGEKRSKYVFETIYKEFSIKIKLFKTQENIIFKYKKLSSIFTLDKLNFFFDNYIKFNSLTEAYKYLKNLFITKKIKIKNSGINFLSLEIEIKTLEPQIKHYKQIILSNNTPKKITSPDFNLKTKICQTNCDYFFDNSFALFESLINHNIFIVYTINNINIQCYNLTFEQISATIIKAHEKNITNFRYHFHKKLKKDLILSISAIEDNIKIWDISNWECILNLTSVNGHGDIFSACFLYDIKNNENYIISSSFDLIIEENDFDQFYQNDISNELKIFDLNGKFIQNINSSKSPTYFVDVYYENEKIYIITGNQDFVRSFDFYKNERYKTYYDKLSTWNNQTEHYSIIIIKNNGIIKIIETSANHGNINIWNFHNGNLIKIIKIDAPGLLGLVSWGDGKFIVGDFKRKMILIDGENENYKKEYIVHDSCVVCLKTINHKKYGKCLVTQGYNEDGIKIWTLE